MPINAVKYRCGHVRHWNGNYCSCVKTELDRINQKEAFGGYNANAVPYDDPIDICPHNTSCECRPWYCPRCGGPDVFPWHYLKRVANYLKWDPS